MYRKDLPFNTSGKQLLPRNGINQNPWNHTESPESKSEKANKISTEKKQPIPDCRWTVARKNTSKEIYD